MLAVDGNDLAAAFSARLLGERPREHKRFLVRKRHTLSRAKRSQRCIESSRANDSVQHNRCVIACRRIDENFRNFYGPNDENMYKLAMSVLRGEHAWLEQGIASGDTEMGQSAGEEVEPAKYGESVRAMAGV